MIQSFTIIIKSNYVSKSYLRYIITSDVHTN